MFPLFDNNSDSKRLLGGVGTSYCMTEKFRTKLIYMKEYRSGSGESRDLKTQIKESSWRFNQYRGETMAKDIL